MFYLGLLLWTLFVWTFPFRINLSHPVAIYSSNSGEGLYKASLTEANFGLLGVDFFESADNKRRWKIHSNFVELDRKENNAFMKGVDSLFYAEKTGNQVRTTSDFGRSDIDERLIFLEGNVAIQSMKGFRFTMEKLNYSGKNHEFTSEERVEMKGPDVLRPVMILRGVGLWANIDSEHFIVQRNVTAQKRLKGGKWLEVQSKKGEFFTQDQKARFMGSVQAVLPQATLKSMELEVNAEEEKEFLDAKGDVQLRSRDRIGYAETAHIEVGSGQIILEGKARVESKGNEVMGRRIILHGDEDRIEVEQARGKIQ